jgi:sec-independent protein translocase protein TatB
MFDIGWGELVVIGVVALIVIGPKELPTVLRTLGQTVAKVKRMASEFQGQFQEAIRESEFHDLQKHAEDLKSSLTGAANFDALTETQAEVERALEAPPETPALEASGETEALEAPTEPPALEAPAERPALEPPAEDAAETASLAEAAEPVPIDVPPPEPVEPVTEKDFVTAEPPPKPAGGAA